MLPRAIDTLGLPFELGDLDLDTEVLGKAHYIDMVEGEGQKPLEAGSLFRLAGDGEMLRPVAASAAERDNFGMDTLREPDLALDPAAGDLLHIIRIDTRGALQQS